MTPDARRTMDVQALRDRIAKADYAVDPRAVADAILRHLASAQSVCSKPASSTSRP